MQRDILLPQLKVKEGLKKIILIYLSLKSTMKNEEERIHCHTTRLKSKKKNRRNGQYLCPMHAVFSVDPSSFPTAV